MKKLFKLGVLLSFSFMFGACKKNLNTNQGLSTNQMLNSTYSDSRDLIEVGILDENGNIIEKFDAEDIVSLIINEEHFNNIEFIGIEYNSQDDVYLTIIVEGENDEIHGIQFPLITIGDKIGMIDPINDDGSINANLASDHTCKGTGCSSCDFTRSGKQITGCECKQGGGACDHTVTKKDNTIDTVSKIGAIIIAIIGILK